MSEPKWTPAQRAAIEDRGGALLVSAAAGSGKTAVLTERAVRLITDPEHPVDADRLLIVCLLYTSRAGQLHYRDTTHINEKEALKSVSFCFRFKFRRGAPCARRGNPPE